MFAKQQTKRSRTQEGHILPGEQSWQEAPSNKWSTTTAVSSCAIIPGTQKLCQLLTKSTVRYTADRHLMKIASQTKLNCMYLFGSYNQIFTIKSKLKVVKK